MQTELHTQASNMNDLDFLYIGWCHETKKGVKSDKVWTAFKAGEVYYAGWGGRGKTISFKKHPNQDELDRVMRTKQKKYDEVDSFQLFTIFPHFKEEVEKRLSFCVLANKVR